eukprot:Pompholyxophrys_sp_v1_NODE_219_length_1108_cov_18.892688.p1 type:complete len:184 gc:universal NODE_219_length_1108_cov_18.892688:604-53(-)
MTIMNFNVAHTVESFTFSQHYLKFMQELNLNYVFRHDQVDRLLGVCSRTASTVLSTADLERLHVMPSSLLSTGNRVWFNGKIWFSKCYQRFSKRINYVVSFEHNNSMCVGNINQFLSIEEELYACLQILKPYQLHYMRETLKIQSCIPPTSSDTLLIVPMRQIICVMIYAHLPPYVFVMQKLT